MIALIKTTNHAIRIKLRKVSFNTEFWNLSKTPQAFTGVNDPKLKVLFIACVESLLTEGFDKLELIFFVLIVLHFRE